MLALGPLVQVSGFDDPLRSDTTLLAAALLTLGYPAASRDYLHLTCETDRGEARWKTVWSFHGESAEPAMRGFGADVLREAWLDPACRWLLRNADSPLAVLKNSLRYEKIYGFTPKYSREQLAQLATPDTWLEAGFRNLVHLLRSLPRAMQEVRLVERFAATRAAFVPRCLPESEKTRRLKFAETTDANKRRSILAA